VELELSTAIFLALSAGFAGMIDAIAGGGGLVQLPALLAGLPRTEVATVLGTNKLSSILGTSVAATTLARKVRPEVRTAVPMVLAAFIGSALGASVATQVPTSFFRPLIVVMLIGVGFYTWKRPALGQVELLRHAPNRRTLLAVGMGLVIGFYDGIFGPGTGSFLVFLLVGYLGYAFLRASATAKIVNLGTNAAAILVFGYSGSVLWILGLTMGVANIVGAIIGARLAIRGGSALVRKVFLFVVAALIAKVGWDVVASLL
jgi:uncharacterized protein